jgi:hypothetical protein
MRKFAPIRFFSLLMTTDYLVRQEVPLPQKLQYGGNFLLMQSQHCPLQWEQILWIYEPDRDKDMMSFENTSVTWPRDSNVWKHSDIKKIAYLFNYEVFNDIVIKGNLK